MTAPGYLSPQQVEQLLQPINPRRVSVLDGLSHVEAYEIRAHLNRIFGFGRWSDELLELAELFALETQTKNGKPAVNVAYRATVRLTVKAPDGSELARYTEAAVGGSIMPDFKRADAYDMAVKTAESQALKRCAVNLGDQFGLSLYRNGSKDAVVIATLVGVPEKADDEGGEKPASVDAVAPDAVPEQQPDPEPSGQLTPAPAATPPADTTAEPEVSKPAQVLADLAAQMPDVDRLKAEVYEQARSRHLLTKPVRDPMSGEVTQLTRVIADAKAHLTQQTQEGSAA